MKLSEITTNGILVNSNSNIVDIDVNADIKDGYYRVYKSSDDYIEIFNYDNLESCLQEYLKAYNGNIPLEDLNQPNCADCRNISKDELFKRIDYLNTMLSSIKYYVQCRNYTEAQKLVDLIPYCNVRRKDTY